MPLTPTAEILRTAAEAGRGVGAFNVILLEHAEALVAGAEAANAPAILQISENAVKYHGALEPVALATLAVARNASVPVAVHHATRPELVHEAVRIGISSVMYDASTLPYEENVAATREIVEYCHAHDVFVEAELGEVGGKDGVHAPGARTDPKQAAAYVEATGVDALAIAVGTSHAMLEKTASLDFDLIAQHRKEVPVPLVLHGSSGVPEPDLTRAVESGMTKINIATALNQAFTSAMCGYLEANPKVVDPRKYLGPARDAVAREVCRLLGVLKAS